MTKYYCDRCGKESNNLAYIIKDYWTTTEEKWVLCDRCVKQFRKWLKQTN